MLDQLNRQRVYQNSRTPHTPNTKKQPLEESNAIVVKHQKKSVIQIIKNFFMKQSKTP